MTLLLHFMQLFLDILSQIRIIYVILYQSILNPSDCSAIFV